MADPAPSAPSREWQHPLLILLAVAFLAALHLFYLFYLELPQRFQTPGGKLYQGLPLFGDEGDYASISRNLAHQGVFGHGPQAVPTARRPPLWPLLLAAWWRLTDNIVHLLICNHLLAVVGAVLAAALAATVFTRRLTQLVLLVIGLNPNSFAYVRLYAEPLFTCLLLLTLIGWVRSRTSPAWPGPFLCGCSCGLLALTRAEGLLLIPLLGAAFLLSSLRNRLPPVPFWIFLAAALLVLTPWLGRNYTALGVIGLVSNAGDTFAGAHNAKVLAEDPGRWLHFDTYATPAQAARRHSLSEAEADRFLWQLGLDHLLTRDFWFLLRLELHKVLITFLPYFVLLPGGDPWLNTLTGLPYMLLWVLFLGCALYWLGRRRPERLLLLPFLAPLMVSLIFYGQVRFRVPYEPVAFALTLGFLMSRQPLRTPPAAEP